MKSAKCVLILFVVFSICTSFVQKLVTTDRFKPGYYYKGTNKMEGYIYYGFTHFDRFDFRDTDGEKIKVSVENCDSFFVENKKFIVLKPVELKLGVLNYPDRKAFAEVVTESGSLHLYIVRAIIGAPPSSNLVMNYFLEKNNSKTYVLAPPNKSKFKKALADLLNDREDIVSKINDGTYNKKNIEALVMDYNQIKK